MNTYTTAGSKVRSYTAPINFKIIDLANGPGELQNVSLHGLRQLDMDAVVLRNFLSAEEIRTLLHHLLAKPENETSKLIDSKTYPCSFAALDRSAPLFHEKLKGYYQLAKKYKNSFPEEFGLDIEEKFTSVLTRLNQGHQAKILETPDDGSYMPFTFRMIIPEHNHINIHCDNMFNQFAPEFYALLNEVAEVKNQLSFFTVLEKPDHGGQLSMYNVAWDVAKEFNIEKQTVILENGKHLHVENPEEVRRDRFDLMPGDMVIFAGGQLYHRVEEVYGSKMRITLGGFIGYSKTNSDIYYWS